MMLSRSQLLLPEVSFAAVERIFSSRSFPLSSLSHEWTTQCEVEAVDEIANEAGNYFALEMVFPSYEGLALFQTKQAAEYTCSKKKQIYNNLQHLDDLLTTMHRNQDHKNKNEGG
ncbi:uncharacterized protein LOC133677187 [Populus nigra]|uniref:uncharacterized protein LOC133677187 n=1 Tax=Populus nigra TaxID=3691 RepID=UPI002B264EFB|nr:uncharacterized protein LOC133677187 [Populus nigra]